MTSEEVRSDIGRPPHFDGTNYPYWHIRMSSFLEAKGLGVWRVTNEGMKPLSRPEKPTKADEKELHLNAIARNSLLESLSIDVFNRVHSEKSAHDIWTKLKELHDGTIDVREQRNSYMRRAYDQFKMLPNELANDMFSRLIVIVNELNAIGLTKIGDADLSRKIVSVLPQEKYGIISTILFSKKKFKDSKPTEVLGKITAFELANKITKEPSTSSQPIASSSQEAIDSSRNQEIEEKDEEKKKQESSKSKKKAQKQESSSSSSEASSSSGEEESGEEEEEQDESYSVEETKQLIKKMEKLLKKLNSKGVPITAEDVIFTEQRRKQRKHGCFGCGEKGHFRDQCPIFAKELKKARKQRKKEKEARERQQALTSVGKWVDIDEKPRKPSSSKASSSSSHKCFMAIGNDESDVSDDDSSPSIEELVEVIREQEEAIKTLMSKYKDLKEKLASSSSNYKELVEKFDIVMNHNDELTKRVKVFEQDKISSHVSSTPPIVEKTKVDASISCIDLIDESCSPSCNETRVENVVVESCDDLIAQENEELKQEVEKLMKDLAKLKGKKASESKKQPTQDNRPKMVKKLEKGETVTCYSCHQEGHKSYECKNIKKKEEKEKKKKENVTPNTKPYLKVDKQKSTPYLLKKKDNKVVAHLINKQGKGWNQPIWVPKEIITTMKGSKKVWVPKAT